MQRLTHSRGQAAAEWVVAAGAVFMLLTLVIETTWWFVLKEHLLLHGQRATEYAAMQGGDPEAARDHLYAHLQPRNLRLTQICVLDPVEAILADFRDDGLSTEAGHDLVRFNHVWRQHEKNVARGWAQGRGPQSGLDISEANMLHLRIVARYPVTLLWARPILGESLAITVQTHAVMQSHRQALAAPCTQGGWLPTFTSVLRRLPTSQTYRSDKGTDTGRDSAQDSERYRGKTRNPNAQRRESPQQTRHRQTTRGRSPKKRQTGSRPERAKAVKKGILHKRPVRRSGRHLS